MNMLGKMPDSGRLISIESLFTRIAIRQFLCDAPPQHAKGSGVQNVVVNQFPRAH